MKDKTIIIINGHGGVGKDTLCKYFCQYYNGMIISMITPIKQKAKRIGWKGDKDDESRAFLSDLKKLLNKYFKECDSYIFDMVEKFDRSDKKVLFIQMREPDDIERFDKALTDKGYRVKTLLVRRKDATKQFGNEADDGVFDYGYDYIFDNDDPIEMAHNKFVMLIKDAVFKEG